MKRLVLKVLTVEPHLTDTSVLWTLQDNGQFLHVRNFPKPLTCILNPILWTPHYSGQRTADLEKCASQPNLLWTVLVTKSSHFKGCLW